MDLLSGVNMVRFFKLKMLPQLQKKGSKTVKGAIRGVFVVAHSRFHPPSIRFAVVPPMVKVQYLIIKRSHALPGLDSARCSSRGNNYNRGGNVIPATLSVIFPYPPHFPSRHVKLRFDDGTPYDAFNLSTSPLSK